MIIVTFNFVAADDQDEVDIVNAINQACETHGIHILNNYSDSPTMEEVGKAQEQGIIDEWGDVT